MVSQLNFDQHKCASVAILLATYNGDNFLAKQLDSLEAQTLSNWRLYASDDGSVDNTMEILRAYQMKWGSERIQIRAGPQKGFAQNFLSLACDPSIKADYYAFCDQDDLWEDFHLIRAIDILTKYPDDLPSLYGGRTKYISENNQILGYSFLFKRVPSFQNALVQNIMGGNTMVFNNAARKLLNDNSQLLCVSHDWWTYLIVSAFDGYMFYDPHPSVCYRQHVDNFFGGNTSVRSKIKRLKNLFNGQFAEWIQININSLDNIKNKLSKEKVLVLERFNNSREGFILLRLLFFFRSGVYRQSIIDNFAITFAVILKKI